jgi:hypothetical protein
MNRSIIITLMVVCLYSCHIKTGSGNIVSETRQVGKFEGVRSSGSIDIEVKNGSNFLVEIEGDDNILPYVITEVKGDMINVHYKSGTSFRNAHVKAFITSPFINKITVSGSGGVISKTTLKDEDQIEFKVSGSGNITASIDAPEVEADISGSGQINLKGRTKDLEARISGSGDLKCRELLAENSNINLSGSGSARVFASQRLKARATGSGNIYFSGNPASQEIKKSGSGSIQPQN